MLGVLVVAGLALGGCAGEVTGTPTAGGSGGSATSSRSEPFEGRLLKPNEVVKADKLDGVALQPITDGVLRNYGTTLTVLEVGTSDVIEGASESDQEDLGADEGSTLLAFRVRVEAPGDSVSDKVTGSVTVDGVSRSLPEFSTVLGSYSKDDSTLQYIVPVPDNRRSVELELKYANLSQKFDLLEGRRVGEAPVVLYRSKSGPDLVNESLTPSQVSVAAMPGSDGEQESYALSGPKATLSFFSTRERRGRLRAGQGVARRDLPADRIGRLVRQVMRGDGGGLHRHRRQGRHLPGPGQPVQDREVRQPADRLRSAG